MEALVHGKKSAGVAHSGGQLGVDILQVLQLARAGPAGDHAGGVGFQQREQVVDVGLVFGIDLGDIRATAHLHGHQPLGSQHFERLAQGGAADAVFLGQAGLVNPAARGQLAAENTLAQPLGYFFIEGAGRQGQGRHGRKCKAK